jgi:hypothetical protein
MHVNSKINNVPRVVYIKESAFYLYSFSPTIYHLGETNGVMDRQAVSDCIQ